MEALQADRIKVANIINEYVKKNGIEIKTCEEIRNILRMNGITEDELGKMEGSDRLQFTDMCYNRTNEGCLHENLREWNKFGSSSEKFKYVFEWLEEDKYTLLGENFKYTGLVKWKPSGSKETKIIGEWINGRVIVYKPSSRGDEKVFFDKLKNESKKLESDISNIKEGKEKEAIIKIRVNQGAFRRGLLRRYNHCCLCGVTNEEFLIASHIKPWSKSDPEEKTDIYNGLLLCPNHDKLFDEGWITFDDNGKIIISKDINKSNKYDSVLLNVNDDMKIEIHNKNKYYIKYHREHIFRDNIKAQP